MFERYTERARRVLFFARYEASQFGAPAIEPEHLLLGLVREVPGIRHVVNEIRVAEPRAFANTTHDGWITSKVKAKLLATEGIPSTHIKVVTESSVVYLMGLVTRKEGDLATETTRTVGGIKRVVRLFEYLD